MQKILIPLAAMIIAYNFIAPAIGFTIAVVYLIMFWIAGKSLQSGIRGVFAHLDPAELHNIAIKAQGHPDDGFKVGVAKSCARIIIERFGPSA